MLNIWLVDLCNNLGFILARADGKDTKDKAGSLLCSIWGDFADRDTKLLSFYWKSQRATLFLSSHWLHGS